MPQEIDMKAPTNTTKVLKDEAKRLTDRIFRHKYCIVQYKNTGKLEYRNIEKHHLIRKGQSTRFKFDIWNILPICENEHRFDKTSAHEAEESFMNWVKENLPLHWAWYKKHKNDSPRTLYPSDWSDICDELRYYANHPYEAEHLIYEKDSI